MQVGRAGHATRTDAEGAMLTTAQRAIIGGGVCILGFLGCYLPWLYTFDGKGTHGEKSAGYHLILNPQKTEFDNMYH